MHVSTTEYILIVAKECSLTVLLGLSTTNVAFQKYNILKQQSKNVVDDKILNNVLTYFKNH